jgi:hypothetical protein
MSKIVGRRPIELKISDQLDGYVPVFNSTTRLWGTINKADLISGSAVTSGSNTFIGNQIISGSLTVYQGITGSLFGTSSYADNAWAIGGNNFIEGNSSRILGTLSDHHLSIHTNGSRIATFTNSGSLFVASYLPNILSNEKVLIDAGETTSYNLIRALSDVDNYSQFVIQNFSTGSSSSSDIVATANNGSELGNYIDMGINSSTFTGEVGDANDAYLYSTGNDLHIGNASNHPIQFFAGGIDNNANRKLQLNPNNSHNMTGSLDVSGSIVAQSFTGSLQGSSSYALTASYADNFTVGGTLTAQTIVVQTITSSTEFTTGSTKNGSLLTNTHEFTGSVGITGSLTVNGRNYINDSSSFESRITTNSSSLSNFSSSYINESSSFASRISTNSSSLSNFSSSYINESSSFASRISTDSSSFVSFSGSYINESSSFASRIATNSSSFVNFSGSYVSESSSFADRIRVNSSSFAGFSGSYINESSSFTGRITTNSGSFASFSGSYVSESSSFASRIITNSASISTLSASFNSFSGSFMTGSFTGSFTGSISGTSSYAAQALTASNATTASSADNFIVRGTLTAQTINVQTITSSIEFNTGSTRNGTLLTNTHEFTGSVGITGSLIVNGSNVILTNQTSSMSVATASFVTLAQTASYVLQAVSASFSSTASSVNQLNQNVVVSGSLTVSGSTNIIGSSGTTLLSSNADTLVFTGSFYASGSLEVNGRNYINDSSSFSSRITTNSSSFANFSGSYVNESASFASRITTNSGSFASFSGSYVSESSSFASRINNISSSLNSFTSSFSTGSFTGSFTGSLFGTSSYASQSLSASYAESAPNYLPLAGGTMTGDIYAAGRSFTFQDLLLGAGTTFGKITTDGSKYISIMPTYNVESARFWSNGNITIQDAGTYVDNGFRLDVSGSGRFTDGLTVTGSLNVTNGITGSLFGTSSYAINALSSSFATSALYWSGSIINAATASYVLQAVSASYASTASFVAGISNGTASLANTASYAATASSADDFTIRGTLTAQTIVAQTITSSIDFVTGSTKNGSLLSNTHEFTGSVGITGSLVVNGSDYTTTSGSTSTRLTSLESFSGVYNTGSFTGSFNGRVTGSFSGSLYNLQNDVLGHIPFFSSSQVLADSIVRQLDNGSGSYSIVINQDNITTAAPEALYVYQPSSTSYNVIAGKGNLNSYLQLNIQNTNTGENASSDVVATANNGDETSNYINMGINSEGFTGSIGNENDAYLYSTGRHLHIGTATNYPIQFFAGGIDTDANRKFQLNPNNSHELTGSLSITEKLNVLGGVTASLQGTASWANNAINAISASYAANATSASYSATASSADNFLVRGTLTAQTIVAQTITSSIEFVTGSTRNGSLLSNTHQFTGSVLITGSLIVNDSNVILSNQTSSMSVLSASYASTASYVETAQTASYVLQAQSASYWSGSIINAATASYVETAQTASYVLNTVNAVNAVSASYASTASYLNPIENSYLVLSQVSQSLNFQDDTEAAAGGVPLGGLYRNGNFILIRIV